MLSLTPVMVKVKASIVCYVCAPCLEQYRVEWTCYYVQCEHYDSWIGCRLNKCLSVNYTPLKIKMVHRGSVISESENVIMESHIHFHCVIPSFLA